MSTWLFDLGNTRLKCAALQADGTVGPILALEHLGGGIGTAMAAALPDRIEVAHLASVAAIDTTVEVMDALASRCRRICRARTLARMDGVRIAYARPGKLGVDRFLTLLAAHGRGGPAVVCGVGTALTVDLIDADGLHHGGRIAPSPRLMRDVLQARSTRLVRDGGEYHEFAADTEDGLVSGCEGAAIALVERSLAEAARRLGTMPALYLHGGGVQALRAHLPGAHWVPGFVLEGLARWVAVEAPSAPVP